jgi:hypothetical protein
LIGAAGGWDNRRMRLVATLSLPALLVSVLILASTTSAEFETASAQTIVWDGRTFSKPEALAAWLRARGLGYQAWAQTHPKAAARLEGREQPPSATPPTASPAAARVAIPIRARAAPAPADSSRGVGATLLVPALAALAGALLVLALLPALHLRRTRLPGALEEHQPELAGAGIAIAIALAAAHLI